MRNFLIGLVALPVVVVAAVLIYWLGAMSFAILGGIVAVLAVAIPFVLKVICFVAIFGIGIWGLGWVVSRIVSHCCDGNKSSSGE